MTYAGPFEEREIKDFDEMRQEFNWTNSTEEDFSDFFHDSQTSDEEIYQQDKSADDTFGH